MHLCIKMISCGKGCKFETAVKVLNGLSVHIDETATRAKLGYSSCQRLEGEFRGDHLIGPMSCFKYLDR